MLMMIIQQSWSIAFYIGFPVIADNTRSHAFFSVETGEVILAAVALASNFFC